VKLQWGRLRYVGWALAVLAVLGTGYAAQQQVMHRAFDGLEADQVSQDAQRIRLAADAEIRLLTSFGATNSYWDDSFANVSQGDPAGFAVSFPPADIRSVYGVDGVLGIGLDGKPLVGGLASSGSDFGQPPAELRDPAVLSGLFDAKGESGTGVCGALATSTVPYLYCGFGSFDGNGNGPGGGLIYLRSLDPDTLRTIGSDIGLDLHLASGVRPGAITWKSLPSRLGTLQVSTTDLDSGHIALAVQVPTGAGGFTLEVVRDRPIHGTALTVGRQLFGLLMVLAALVLGALAFGLRQGVRRRIEPLRRTMDAVVTSGDRTLRIGNHTGSDVGPLAQAIDTMLDTLATQEQLLAREQAEREQHLAATFEQQQQAQSESQQRSREVVDQAMEAVGQELAGVTQEVEQVRDGALTIDQRVEATGEAARSVVEQASRADAVAADLDESLRKVNGIAGMIRAVADQTKLLALNATIEAERAGPAGRGFSVVASEVKELAAATAQSTQEISQTVAGLTDKAAELSQAIEGVVARIDDISGASGDLREVAASQRLTLTRLDERISQAMTRITTIAQP
jgi:methyl-accepting chemotaxis protein